MTEKLLNNLEENDKILLQLLMESFSYQLSRYELLCEIGRKMINILLLRRGDVNKIKEMLIEKKRLILEIEEEKKAKAKYITLWNEKKSSINSCLEKEKFEELLEKITSTLKEFLDIEEQLRKLMEALIKA